MGEEGHAASLAADIHAPAEELYHEPHAEDESRRDFCNAQAWYQDQDASSREQ